MNSKVELVIPVKPKKKELSLDDVPAGSFFTAEDDTGKRRLYQRVRDSSNNDLKYGGNNALARFLDPTTGCVWNLVYRKNITIVDVTITVNE